MQVRHDDSDVRSRIEDLLGVTVEALARVVERGAEARRSTTAFHPSSYAGTSMWADATAALRRALPGWSIDEDGGQPRTFDLDRRINVAVQSGDEMTGVLGDRPPRTKHPKGQATVTKVRDNQMRLFEISSSTTSLVAATMEEDAGLDDLNPTLDTWFLLLAEVDGELRAELSHPEAFDRNGRVSSWYERVLLPATPMAAEHFDVARDDDGDEGDGFDVQWQS